MMQHTTMTAVLEGIEFCWAARSDIGKRRALNEDNFLALPGVFVVADGMGGHALGDVASKVVVDKMAEAAAERGAGGVLSINEVQVLVTAANTKVRNAAQGAGSQAMGTTMVAALIARDGERLRMVVLNVGDSRCYLLGDGGFGVLTRDHSLVQELVDAGELSEAEAAAHPDRNIVTRAIGVNDDVEADLFVVDMAPHQRLLLCSDGVSSHVPEAVLREWVAIEDPSMAVDAIIDGVLSGPAPDNATAVVVDISWPTELLDLNMVEVTAPRPAAGAVDASTGFATGHNSVRRQDAGRAGLISEVPR